MKKKAVVVMIDAGMGGPGICQAVALIDERDQRVRQRVEVLKNMGDICTEIEIMELSTVDEIIDMLTEE